MNSNPRCEACGMPMNNTPRHSKQNLIGRYCLYCTTPAGELKSRDEIREGMIQYKMNLENWARSQAEAAVDQQMAQLPAWQGAA